MFARNNNDDGSRTYRVRPLSPVRKPPKEVVLTAQRGPRVVVRSEDLELFDVDWFAAPHADPDERCDIGIDEVYEMIEAAFGGLA